MKATNFHDLIQVQNLEEKKASLGIEDFILKFWKKKKKNKNEFELHELFWKLVKPCHEQLRKYILKKNQAKRQALTLKTSSWSFVRRKKYFLAQIWMSWTVLKNHQSLREEAKSTVCWVGLLTTDTLQSFHFKKVHKSLLKLSTDDKEMTWSK